MNQHTWIILAGIGVLGLFALAVIAVVLVKVIQRKSDQKYEAAVMETSPRYSDLERLNDEYNFYPLSAYYIKTTVLDSKAHCDRYPFDESFLELVQYDHEELFQLESKVLTNRRLYELYLESLEEIHPYAEESFVRDLHLRWNKYHDWEVQLTESMIRKPVMDVWIRCIKTYVTPQGKRCYGDAHDYSLTEFNDRLRELEQARRQMVTAAYQHHG
jgi:hypothetical protein